MKKIFALICIASMLLSCSATFAFAVDDHVHDGIEFAPWASADSLPNEDGRYYLTTDVTLSSTWFVPAGKTDLCLNGHRIIAGDAFDKTRLIQIEHDEIKDTELNLFDCGTQKYHFDINSESGLAENIKLADNNDTNGGKIFTGGYICGSGKSVIGVVIEEGCFNMYGGTIIGNGLSGVVLKNQSVFNLHGGNILGNASPIGGGVMVEKGSFTMTGGRISYNTVKKIIDGGQSFGGNGGGVKLEIGSITMSGGEISYNTAENYGGGVSLNSRDDSLYLLSMTMTGGSIMNNISQSGGGGIDIKSNNSFLVSGDPVISGNQKTLNGQSEMSNAMLNDAKITVNDELKEGCKIGVKTTEAVTAGNPFEFTSGYSSSGNTADPSAYFASDDPDCSVGLNTKGEAILGKPYAITNATPASSFGTITVPDAAAESSVVEIQASPDEGYVFSIDVKDSNGDPVQTEGTGNTRSFTMPASAVTVTAVFKKVIEPQVSIEGWTYGSYDPDKNSPVVTGNEGQGEESFVYYTDEECKTKTTAENSGATVNGGMPVNAGTYWIKATIAETEAYTAGTAVAKFTVSKAVLTVTFVDGQGKTLKTEKVESGKSATAPAEPERSGYTFTGWDKDFSNVTENMTVTAKWKKNAEPAPVTKISGTLLAKMTTKGSKSLVLTWKKINGAQGYDIFFVRCSDNESLKKVKTIKGNRALTWTKKNLRKKTAYKAVVKAWVKKDGKKTYVKTSPAVHAYTSGGKKYFTNPESVTMNKPNVSLKKGKTFKIEASVTGLQKGKALIPDCHEPELRYVSSNKNVATVSKSGKITAKSKGKCKVYVIAVNGVRKAVKVTVK